jgi:transcriptional regulator
MHGYELMQHIERLSNDTLRLEEGSLYPALHRLKHAGALRAEWGASDNNRRARYYSITTAGRKQLAVEEDSWVRLTDAVTRVLRHA